MDEHTHRVLEALERGFEQFRENRIDLVELQSITEGIAQAFESDSAQGVAREVMRLAGALEHIRWMSVPEDQRSNAEEKIWAFEEYVSQTREKNE